MKDEEQKVLRAAWEHVEKYPVYLLRVGEMGMFVEPPSETGTIECILRVFGSQAAAQMWCGKMKAANAELVVAQATVKDVIAKLPELNEQSKQLTGCPIRLDICVVDREGWPKSVDTLWTEMATKN